jgi:hypothetical protein
MERLVYIEKNMVCAAAVVLLVALLVPQEAWAKERKSKSADDSASQKVKWTKSPDAIPALINLSNGRKDMTADINVQNAAYGKVRSAAQGGGIANGDTMDQIKARYGEPVNVDTQNADGVTKWVYKKVSKDIASKEKIYLVFDKDGKLTGWEEPK